MRHLATQLARCLPPADARTDGDLLAAFLTGSEDDFAELVRRHGPLVWGVCRRSLPDPADAEDAFQSAFLVLVRRANRLTAAATVGPWLHRVATWTARNVRRRNARRLAKSGPLPDHVVAASTDPDARLDLDAALLALPEKYRSPIVLCHLLGLTRAEAAGRLGCAEGTLSSWLSRGLAKLRNRLGGHDPAKVLGGAATLPASLSGSAVRAAVAARAAVALAPSTALLVAEGVLRMFWVKKATAAAAALFAVFAFGVGVGLTTRQVPHADGQVKAGSMEPVPMSTPPIAPADPTVEKQLAELEALLRAKNAVADALGSGAKVLLEKVDRMKALGATAEEIAYARAAFEEARKAAGEASKEVENVAQRIAELKAKIAAAQKPPALAEVDQRIAALKAELVQLVVQRGETERDAKRIAEQLFSLRGQEARTRSELEILVAKRAELAKMAADRPAAGAYVELTVGGPVDFTTEGPAVRVEFTLKETDAAGKEIGTVLIREPEMLRKLLARLKKDATAPKELRVVVQPQTANGVGPLVAFKACDAAGFTSVKFTGHIVTGLLPFPIKPDHKGAAAGFKWYDGSERSPASLIKEYEDGSRKD